MLWRLLDPRNGWVAFTFLSHKILRWIGPFFLVGALATNLLLWRDDRLYVHTLVGQAAFYLTSLLAACVPTHFRWLKPLRLTTMFTAMNAALFVGFCRWMWGTQKGTWKRTERLVEAQEA